MLEGKTTALVGSSGCGKSTLIQLLERFYDPTLGDVQVDGDSLRYMDLKMVRSQLGIVSQEPNLFNRTIAENIAYGANGRHVTMEEIIDASKKANIYNFVSSLPLVITMCTVRVWFGNDGRFVGLRNQAGRKSDSAVGRAKAKDSDSESLSEKSEGVTFRRSNFRLRQRKREGLINNYTVTSDD